MKVLNETYVADDISVKKLDRLVGNISADNFISFSDDEIPPGARGSTKALHVTTRCKGYTLPGVLVDNGSALNVLPWATLNRLPIDSSHMKTCQNIVRAFDGTERKVMGRIEVPLQIGPNTYEVDFLVMDIKPSYNYLLGRPWIHSAGAVPSSLHQKLKMVTDGLLVTINAEEDIIASVTSDAPYIENDNEAVECSFRSLEFVNAMFIAEGNRIPIPRISGATKMSLQLTVGKGALPGRGLGKHLRGQVRVPVLVGKWDRFGLGFRPDASQVKKEFERKQEQRRARLSGTEVRWEPMSFHHISQTFVSGGFIHSAQERIKEGMVGDVMGIWSVNATFEEEAIERNLSGICPYEPGSVLNNWTVEEIPVIFRDNTEPPDVNVMSNADTSPESPFEQDMRFEGFQDFEEDEDRGLSPDLLRMVVNYSEWVANVVHVPKKDGKVQMCVDYRDLNKASPKDNFLLPHIDTLVDNTVGYSLFSFMDGFFEYNQIKMHPEDMEKTIFVTLWGTFCYKEIEVYVDDMIAKSRTEEEHVRVLRKLFLRLRKFQLKLNPSKCTFGARSGKLLGFVVNEKGIEVDLDKVKAIRSCLRHELRKKSEHNPGVWDDECQKTFEKVKQYLSSPLVLTPPSPGRPLILYLTVFDNSMGCVLGQHDETGRKERAIYYLSKKFTECEMRYPPIEKLCCTLVWTTRRLRQYMFYHTTWLISKLDPLKYMMESTALNGRMARWQILLSEFDIVYVNQKAVKGSAIADFLASRTLEDYEPLNFNFPNEDLMYIAITEGDMPEDHSWKLNFDGASNAIGNGVGTVLISPNGDHYPFTCKLDFDCTNNMVEYEACIMGIRTAIDHEIKVLEVYGDSALIIYQLKGEWETRDPKLISYRKLILKLIKKFDDITFHYLPRDENQMADALATLASMVKVNE
ncbi:uncharacterized protein [Gossypium hirsutum]|uniref:RNA-directed DNA polymerase n=1 Tax=Gossypium hirsutum TaxID=3635 RepID=A0A1U8P8N0_GOSHI|nr:uncharacterized protein LOC107956384 [Gossypium hirsutum]